MTEIGCKKRKYFALCGMPARRSGPIGFCAILLLGGMGFMALGVWDQPRVAHDRRVIVLGIDAMDYEITRTLIAEGKLPNLKSLAENGTFMPLQTSMPPLSPVAWSNFITGTNPGGHGVYDFLRRDPQRVGDVFLPEDGVTKNIESTNEKAWSIPLTSYVWPAEKKQVLLRKAPAFWELLEKNNVDSIIYKIPGNYPVSATSAKTISGMGTPDIEGTYGTFTYLTDQSADGARDVSGGRIYHVKLQKGKVVVVENETNQHAPYLTGPTNIFLPERSPTKVPFEVYVDSCQKTAAITIQNQDIVLKQGEWSEWVNVDFKLIPEVKSVGGIVRFFLKEASPAFRLYVSPVNLAAGSEGLATNNFDLELVKAIGLYDTKGMPQETKAFMQGLLTPEEYLQQSDLVLKKDIDALNYLLDQKNAFMFFYFSTIDLDSHVFWKYQDVGHPAYNPKNDLQYANVIRNRYIRMDQIVGHVMEKLRPQDALYIVSDHGFTSFRREFNLMTWLEKEGYLVYSSPLKKQLSKFYSDIDWKQSRAYGIGFNGVYLNLKGREANGNVDPQAYDVLLEEIRMKLLALTDQGQPVFHHIYRGSEIYRGNDENEAPDLVLGYNCGYGPSDQSVLGTWTQEMIKDHLEGFSGQHEVDYTLVPGVLFSTRKLQCRQAALADVTVTLLKETMIDPGTAMTGKPLF